MLGLPFIHWLVVLSVLSTAGASVYIRDTLVGKTKPNRVSWSMWALSPLSSPLDSAQNLALSRD